MREDSIDGDDGDVYGDGCRRNGIGRYVCILIISIWPASQPASQAQVILVAWSLAAVSLLDERATL